MRRAQGSFDSAVTSLRYVTAALRMTESEDDLGEDLRDDESGGCARCG